MLGIDRKAAKFTWTAAAVVLFLCLIYLVRSTLFIFTLAVLLAYLLSPLVNLLDRFLPSRTRAPALALSYVIFIGLLVLIGIELGSRIVEEGGTLAKRLPETLATWEHPSPGAPGPVNSLKAQIVDKARTELAARSGDIVSTLTRAGVKFITFASDLIFVVIIPILAFFFLKDAHLMRQHILDLVDQGPRRELLDDVMADVHLLLAHYMRALVVLSLACFSAYAIFFSAMGVPYAILLAAIGGLFEFIPMLGPLTSGILIVVVSAASGSHVLAVIVFLLAYRVFQDYVLSPHLMGQGVELHPLLVLFGVFAGAEVAGIAGTFLSVPVLALVRILYLRIRKARVTAQLNPPARVML